MKIRIIFRHVYSALSQLYCLKFTFKLVNMARSYDDVVFGQLLSGYSALHRVSSVRHFPPRTYSPRHFPAGQFPFPPRISSPAVKAKTWKLALTHTPIDPNRPTTRSTDPNWPTTWVPDPNPNLNRNPPTHGAWNYLKTGTNPHC